jgi:hypothetical protein
MHQQMMNLMLHPHQMPNATTAVMPAEPEVPVASLPVVHEVPAEVPPERPQDMQPPEGPDPAACQTCSGNISATTRRIGCVFDLQIEPSDTSPNLFNEYRKCHSRIMTLWLRCQFLVVKLAGGQGSRVGWSLVHEVGGEGPTSCGC